MWEWEKGKDGKDGRARGKGGRVQGGKRGEGLWVGEKGGRFMVWEE